MRVIKVYQVDLAGCFEQWELEDLYDVEGCNVMPNAEKTALFVIPRDGQDCEETLELDDRIESYTELLVEEYRQSEVQLVDGHPHVSGIPLESWYEPWAGDVAAYCEVSV